MSGDVIIKIIDGKVVERTDKKEYSYLMDRKLKDY